MPKINSVNDIFRLPNWQKKYVEMVEPDSLGRRWFMGFKLRSNRSRKKRVVFLCRPPIQLDAIVAAHERTKSAVLASDAAAASGAPHPP